MRSQLRAAQQSQAAAEATAASALATAASAEIKAVAAEARAATAEQNSQRLKALAISVDKMRKVWSQSVVHASILFRVLLGLCARCRCCEVSSIHCVIWCSRAA